MVPCRATAVPVALLAAAASGDDSEDEEPQQLSQPSKLASTTVAAGASGAAAAVPTSLVEAGLPGMNCPLFSVPLHCDTTNARLLRK